MSTRHKITLAAELAICLDAEENAPPTDEAERVVRKFLENYGCLDVVVHWLTSEIVSRENGGAHA